MRTIVQIASDGRVVTCPIVHFAATMTVHREAPQEVHELAITHLRERVNRWAEQGWSLDVAEPVLSMDDDFLRNQVRYQLEVDGYVGPNAWTAVDRRVDEHTRGGWRREREAEQW